MESIAKKLHLSFSLLRGVFSSFPALLRDSSFRQERRNSAYPLCSRPSREEDGCAPGTGGGVCHSGKRRSVIVFPSFQ